MSGPICVTNYGSECYAATADLAAQAAAVSSVVSYTPYRAGTFQVSGYLTITNIATDVIEFQVSYTDENSNVQTQAFFPQGIASALLSSTGAYTFPPMNIRSGAGTPITVKTNLTTTGGSITYDVGAAIMPIS